MNNSMLTASGVRIKVHADPLYQHLLVTAEKTKRAAPAIFNTETPRPRLEAVKIIEIWSLNQWATAANYLRTREAHREYETEIWARISKSLANPSGVR